MKNVTFHREITVQREVTIRIVLLQDDDKGKIAFTYGGMQATRNEQDRYPSE
jgi:1,4-dihydroxy-2-naphthoyl-CoA synthase